MTLMLKELCGLSPWRVWRDLEGEAHRSFDEGPLGFEPTGTWAPKVDVAETPEAYILAADLPGMCKDDIEITVLDNVVTLKGERKEESEFEVSGRKCHERRFGKFERWFEVPGGFEAGKVNAEFKDGVLRVTLPKSEKGKPKQIEVKFN